MIFLPTSALRNGLRLYKTDACNQTGKIQKVPEYDISSFVGFPTFDQWKLACNGFFENVMSTIKRTLLH